MDLSTGSDLEIPLVVNAFSWASNCMDLIYCCSTQEISNLGLDKWMYDILYHIRCMTYFTIYDKVYDFPLHLVVEHDPE